MNFIVCFVAVVIAATSVTFSVSTGVVIPLSGGIKDVPGEECLRPCVEGGAPLRCHYSFALESYYVLSLACFACPYNISDCYRPDCVAADGTLKTILTVNRQIPGPSIEVCRGDTIVVDVDNEANPQTTSIHWHGILQHGTPYMDGVPMITQCPIQPFNSFHYRFKVPEPGTYFWHGHSASQKVDGLFGPLVVRQPGDAQRYNYDYDLSEHIISANDWYNVSMVELFARAEFYYMYLHPHTILVNGKGRFTNYTQNGTVYQTPLAVFTVQHGKRYRFRFIGSGVQCAIQLSVVSHRLEIIETDGRPVEPMVVDGVNILSGERYDFILDASQPVGNYWMKFTGLEDCDNRTVSAFQMAILRYVGAPIEEPPGTPSWDFNLATGFVLNPVTPNSHSLAGAVTVLRSALPNDVTVQKSVPDVQFILEYDYRVINDTIYNRPEYYQGNHTLPYHTAHPLPLINYIFNTFAPSPLLSQFNSIPKDMLCDPDSLRKEGKNCMVDFCMCVHLLKVPLRAVVELILIDDGIFNSMYADHPFHLHGHSFRVLALGKFSEDNITAAEVRQLAKQNKIVQRLDHAVCKDTINVPNGGYAVIRFFTDNPGFWLLHCHNDVHLEVGMGLTFQAGEIWNYPKPPKDFPDCGDF